MLRVTPVESPRSAASSAAALVAKLASLSGASDDLDVEGLPPGWRSLDAVPAASDAPPLPDVEEGPRTPNLDALSLARAASWVPPFAWAHAMEVLFDLGMANTRDSRAMRNLMVTADQQAKREAHGAMVERVKAQRTAAGSHILIAAVASAMPLVAGTAANIGGGALREQLGFLGQQLMQMTQQAGNYVEQGYGSGTAKANQMEIRKNFWETLQRTYERTERSSDDSVQQNQRNLTALLDMLVQLEQKRGQAVSQINQNV